MEFGEKKGKDEDEGGEQEERTEAWKLKRRIRRKIRRK